MLTPEGSPGSSRAAVPVERWLGVFVMALAAVMLVGALWRFGHVSRVQLRAPFDLCFESPNLSTIKAIRAGQNVYAPQVYADVPFCITIYTPLYHCLVAALPTPRTNEFLAGRVVSLFCVILATLGIVVAWRRPGPLAVPLLMVAVFLLFRPAVAYAAYLKNDTLALLFSVAAVSLLARARLGPRPS